MKQTLRIDTTDGYLELSPVDTFTAVGEEANVLRHKFNQIERILNVHAMRGAFYFYGINLTIDHMYKELPCESKPENSRKQKTQEGSLFTRDGEV